MMQSQRTDYHGFDVAIRPGVVAAAGGFIGGHRGAQLARRGALVRARTLSRSPRGSSAFRGPRRSAPTSRTATPATASSTAPTWSSTSRPTWGAWASSRTTRPGARRRDRSTRTCYGGARRTACSGPLMRRLHVCTWRTSRIGPMSTCPEADAYPAMPEDRHGWRSSPASGCAVTSREDFGLDTRVARYHNVYGPSGTYDRRAGEGTGCDLPQSHRSQAHG